MTQQSSDDSDASTPSIAQPRTWTPYELTQLARYSLQPEQFPADTQSPVEYLTGHVDFAGLDFLVSPDTLIPRLETEELVDMAWEAVQSAASGMRSGRIRFLDVGTGCGAIPITIAHRAQLSGMELEIIATDISAPALAVAQKNAQRLVPDMHIEWIESNLLTNVPTSMVADVLTANLPYIPSDRIWYLESSVKDFEPHVALDGGPDGLRLIRQLLATASQFVAPSGCIMLEVDYTHSQENFREFQNQWNIQARFDSFSRNRFAVATKK